MSTFKLDTVVQSYLNLRITFSEEALINDALLYTGTYSVTPNTPGDAVYVQINDVIPEPDVDDPLYVDLVLTDCTIGEYYNLWVEPDAIRAYAAANYLEEPDNEYQYIGVSNSPEILLIETLSRTQIRVLFSKDMAMNDDLTDISNYVFDGGLRALSVEVESPGSVIVTTSEQTPFQSYQLTVG